MTSAAPLTKIRTMSAQGQNRPFRPVPLNDRNTLKSGNQELERRLTTAKRKPPHVFPDFRLVPQAEIRNSPYNNGLAEIIYLGFGVEVMYGGAGNGS